MDKLKTDPPHLVDVTEDYISSQLPTLQLPLFTGVIGPFIANIYLLHVHITDLQS